MQNKVGIVTFFGLYNYGNRLQNYAVASYLKRRGFCSETLIVDAKSRTQKIKDIIKKLIGMQVAGVQQDRRREERFIRFNEFGSFRRVSNEDLKNISDEYLFFVTGSDQVWNPCYSSNISPYFLSFARREQRVPISPSIGISDIPESKKKTMKEGLAGFDHLSVREYSGAAIIQELTGRDASVLIDPTMMIDVDEWRSLSVDDFVPEAPYVFVYTLGELDEAQESILADAMEKKGAECLRISDTLLSDELPLGPGDFISLIDNAECVLTDSFHGTVFSLLFKKPVVIFKRNGVHSDIFSRLETLVRKFGLQGRVAGEKGFSLCFDEHAYDDFDEVLESERRAFDEFFTESISGLGR